MLSRTRQLLAQAESIQARSRSLVAETLVVIEQNQRTMSLSCLGRIDRIMATHLVEDTSGLEMRANRLVTSLEEVLEDTDDALGACESGLYDG